MKKVFIVLGMHRSGTSCLTGTIENTGTYLGNVSCHNAFNLKGNKENWQIISLNDDVLKYNKGAWDDPPTEVEWPMHLKKKRDAIIGQNKESFPWAFKDPRTLLTLPGWLETLQQVSFVATYRHPSLVAQSLLRRNDFSVEKSLRLWKIYNEKILYYHGKYRFPLISFDLAPDEYTGKVKELLRQVGLETKSGSNDFFDAGLRHHSDILYGDVPEDILKIYEILNQTAI